MVESAGNTVPLKSLNAGDTVHFGGQTWIVLDPGSGYLLMKYFYGVDREFDKSTWGDKPNNTPWIFGNPNDPNNIAYYLNNTFLNSLDIADRSLIQSHSWTNGNEINDATSTVTCDIGLISYGEYKNIQNSINSLPDIWWTRTTMSGPILGDWEVGADGELFIAAPNDIASVRPALYLDPNDLVSGGSGSTVLGGKYNVASAPVNSPAGTIFPIVNVDGKELTFDVPPTIENGHVLVPVRAIFEALGAQVTWGGSLVTATKGSTSIKLEIGGHAFINDVPVTLDVPAKIVNGRMLVPLRFVSEALGAKVDWDGSTQTVTIISTSTAPS
jgi:hypothetical protein